MTSRKFRSLLSFAAFLILLATPALGVQPEDVVSFLNEEFPRVNGTIIYQENDEFYAEINTNVSEARVEIYRQEVKSSDDGQRLTETVVGLASLTLRQAESLKLDLPEPMKDQIRLGDRLRLPDRPLLVRNRSNRSTPELREQVESNPRIGTVLTDEAEVPANYYRLTVDADELTLSRVSPDQEPRTLARHSLQPRRGERGSETQTEPRDVLDSVRTFDRVIGDLEILKLSDEAFDLVLLASRNEIGFARYDGSFSEISWDSIRGDVLDVSVGPKKKGSAKFPVLVVVKNNGTLRTRYYRLNPSNRSIDRLWTVSHRWIRESAGSYYSQRIGLNTPMEPGLTNVELGKDGPRTVEGKRDLSDYYIYSPSYKISDNRLYSLTKNQHFEILEDGEQVLRTSEEYGGSPTVVSARNSGSKITLNPEFTLWNSGETTGQHVLLPRNLTSGISVFRGLISYDGSRLYLLEYEDSTLERLWESDQLPGYLSSVTKQGGDALATVVNSESESTEIFSVSVSQLK